MQKKLKIFGLVAKNPKNNVTRNKIKDMIYLYKRTIPRFKFQMKLKGEFKWTKEISM